SDGARLDRTEQTALGAGLDGQLDLGALERGLEGLRVFEHVDDAGVAGRADLRNLLLATAAPCHGEALGDEVVAGVPGLDLDDVTGAAETGNLVRKNQLRHISSPLPAGAGVGKQC